MKSVLKWVSFATVLALAPALPAQAVTVPNPDVGLSPGTMTLPSGWTIQISGCAGTGSQCATETMTASVVGLQLSLVFTGTNGPSLNAFLYNGGGGLVDESFNLVVTAPTGQVIWGASDAFSASSSTTALPGVITATETFTGPSEPQLQSTLSPSATLSLAEFTSITHAVTASVDVNAGFGGGKVTTIPSLTLTFNAPEPISSSLMVVGIAGLGLVRRKLRRAS